ncbi:glyoxalase superfamily protein [Maritimibacter sp. UBA3975]|uniref:glyoxalase superfamily protein n=1 Tax=Maritimibacter sp. UBA3975 TaxID=1946833 RepID=UPI000C0AD95C|nr:glyoxalase superfamily protein [Maritimibacter sp. UBA3975]MAM63922.1 glyoxalase/bleomycin resistance/extradiol dioxygenase family protein [Maritimibacter sp.]|tara:strand:+ start:19033 stop:19395 length:363 start_codon:yes stop_codon:yes gene_type:complete
MPAGAAVPILRSFSEGEARDFYLRYLGFDVLFEHRFAPEAPLYMGLRLGNCEIHLSEHHGDASPGSAVRIEVSDIDAFHAEITARGHARLRPGIEDQSWGAREVNLRDPFGNRLVFWQST